MSVVTILSKNGRGAFDELPADRLAEIDPSRASPDDLVWVSVEKPGAPLVESLGRQFDLHRLAIEDLTKRRQRPKLDTYGSQSMVVVYEATAKAKSGIAEIHLFVGPTWILSVHWEPTPTVDAVRRRLSQPNGVRRAGDLLYVLLDAAVDSYFPELDRISERIDSLEDRVLQGEADRRNLEEILALKRQLLEQRRVLAPMRDVANLLLRRELDFVDDQSEPYYQDLYDHLVRVLDQVDLYRDLLAAVLDARLSVASNALNAIMKRLTAFTVILMVPTLIAGIYGMNFRFMPELRWAAGYPFALLLMAGSAGLAIFWFWRNDWF
ncbi:MAG TPA: magnesium/cobalt transporter CorA [Candidatus Limnocylindria bacterium]|nr:magnesium/cobalt transporter CorA [Candidatus Limnocylindria bacterium]